MAQSRSGRSKTRKRNTRGDLRFVKSRSGSSPSKRKKSKKAAARSAARSAAQSAVFGDSQPATASDLPAWDDLLDDNASKGAAYKEPTGRLAAMSTARVALIIIATAGLLALYVGHIYATQDLLADVQRLRSENLELYLEKNRLASAWDSKTAPPVIYQRTREMGLRERAPEGEPVIIE